MAWYDKALSRLNAEVELKEAAAGTCWNIAYQLYEEKKLAERLPLLTKAIELKPDYALAYNSRGVAYAELEQYELALVDYTSAISLDPNFAFAYYNRGIAYDNLKQYKSAIADYTSAISLDPNYADAYYNRGLLYDDLKQYKSALADYTSAISLDPNDTDAYYNRGWVYDELKQYKLAIADYTSTISLDPNDANAYHNRGWAYYELKQYESAIADYSTVLALDPNDVNAYNNRGWAYLRLRDITKARDDFRRSHELDAADIDASWMAEWADMSIERIDREIVTCLEQIANIDPEHYLAYVCRGVALGLRGKLKQGLDEIAQAIPLKPEEFDPYFWQGMLRAYYYREPSHDRETMESFRKALEVGLPPVLLTPLYWLERDNSAFFARCAKGLLEEYDV